MFKPLSKEQREKRLERKLERAKDPLSVLIHATSAEMRMMSGRLQTADTIVREFRSRSGLKYNMDLASGAIKEFTDICLEIDKFNAKYFKTIFPTSKDKYQLLDLIGSKEAKEPAKEPEEAPKKAKKEDKVAD